MEEHNLEPRDKALAKVLAIIFDHGHDITDVTPETPLKDWIDSLEIFDIAIAVEKQVNRNIADSELEDWKTVSDIVTSYLKSK